VGTATDLMKRRRVLVATVGALAVALAGAALFVLIPRRIVRVFPSAGVSTVVLRAGSVESVQVSHLPRGSSEIRVSGLPAGGARGYHPSSWWRETPARSWGLDFVARQFGSVLVISTKNEIAFMHHYYHLDAIALGVPEASWCFPSRGSCPERAPRILVHPTWAPRQRERRAEHRSDPVKRGAAPGAATSRSLI